MTTKTTVVNNVEISTSYNRHFTRRDGLGGFSFPCDAGGLFTGGHQYAWENWMDCLSGKHDVIDDGIQTTVYRTRLCHCGSGEHPEAEYDARGIFLCKCCPKFKPERMKGYRPEVLTDGDYDTYDEQIDEDY